MRVDVIVVGAGASGLMCAIEAGKRGRAVLVLEHTQRLGNKISVSGGGRCNFTNRNVGTEHYFSHNPRFATSALARFTPSDFISMLQGHGIGYHEREMGRLFCNESSRDITDMLRTECDRAFVRIVFECNISAIEKDRGFRVVTNRGIFHSESLAVATGGLSLPNIGATNFGYSTAKQFGLRVTKLKPALTPLQFNPEQTGMFGSLTGISLDASVSCKGERFRDKILFTHKGLSGPAILQVSSSWEREETVSIDLLPDIDIRGVLIENRHTNTLLSTFLGRYMPGRFAKTWCDLYFSSKPLNRYSNREFEAIAAGLHDWRILPIGTEGFNKAEVTLGGVDTDELSSRTMEARKVPGLYFLGEVIDVTGQLGGYNLHWAWASGHAAGQHI